MRKNKLDIAQVDENGDLHFSDGFFLSWAEAWEEAIRRCNWRQRGHGKLGAAGKINNVIKDKHNLWKMEYPDGFDGQKITLSNLVGPKSLEYYNLRRSLGLEPKGSRKKKRTDCMPDVIPDECIRCLNLLECCDGETEEAKKLFKKRVALFKRIKFCEDYEPDLFYINRGY